MRTLIVNSMFANSHYRRCADELGRRSGIDLTMLTVDEWRMNGRSLPLDEIAVGSPYRTVIGKVGWKGYENRGFYTSGIIDAFRLSKPEVLFLMEEPFSVFAAQMLSVRALAAPRIPVVFFTWNNLSLQTFDYRPSFFYRNVAHWALKRMNYALTANIAGVEVLRRSGFEKPIKVVGYGVDTLAFSESNQDQKKFLRQSLSLAEEDMVIGYVGRLIPMKGVDLLIEAFAQLKAIQPNRNLKLLLIGGGEEKAALLERARARGIADDLRHVDVVPQRDVPSYMQIMDVLVLPSRRQGMWAEQFGRVLIEGMAAGAIVVGSSSGAIPEVIGNAGFVFQESDVNSLVQTLTQVLMLSPDQASLLRSAAARRAAEDFSWSRFARDAFSAIEYCHRTYSVR